MDFLFATRSIQRILYLLLLVSICFFIYHNPNDLTRYFAVWPAFFLSLIIWEETPTFGLKLMLQTGLGFVLVVSLFGFLAPYPLFIPLVLFVFSIWVLLFSQRRPQYALSILVIMLFAIISGLSAPTVIENYKKIIMLGIGLLVALLCYLLFYLRPIKDRLRVNVYASLSNLLSLNKAVFESLIDPQYKNNLYLFERRIHLSKNKCIQTFITFSQGLPKKDCSDFYLRYCSLLDKLNLLYDHLLDCSILRFRIKDHTILKVCEAELIGILSAINQVIIGWMKIFSRSWFKPAVNSRKHLDQLSHWIFKLEENYQHFLQAIAADPLAFLLFIESLKSLTKEMESFSQLVSLTRRFASTSPDNRER